MAEPAQLEDVETGEKTSQCRYLRAKVLDSHLPGGIHDIVKEPFDEKNIVFTDNSISYVDIFDYVELHFSEKSSGELTKKTLRWSHITISNAKRNFVGNYRKVKGKYLQLYLNEFVYKLNRMYFGEKLFDKLVIAGITGL